MVMGSGRAFFGQAEISYNQSALPIAELVTHLRASEKIAMFSRQSLGLMYCMPFQAPTGFPTINMYLNQAAQSKSAGTVCAAASQSDLVVVPLSAMVYNCRKTGSVSPGQTRAMP